MEITLIQSILFQERDTINFVGAHEGGISFTVDRKERYHWEGEFKVTI